MDFEHFERGYLLPKGCKDLIDVIHLYGHLDATIFLKSAPNPSQPAPTFHGELVVPEHTTVAELAQLLKQKPFKIIADLMQLGVFATANQSLGFEAVARIARAYGYIAKKQA